MLHRSWTFRVAALIGIVLSSSCSTDTLNPDPSSIASVAIEPASASVAVGAHLAFYAEVRGAQGQVLLGQRVRWASENPSIAGVSDAGVVRGSAAEELKRLEDALARTPLRTLPDAERPDPVVAINFALAGRPDRARTILSDYRASVRDTALLRSLQPDLHNAEAMIALAEQRPLDAIAQFRKGDSLPDGPAYWSTTTLPRNLGLAFDAAKEPDSAIAQYELAINTPDLDRSVEWLDPMSLAPMHERLGQLYESKGDTAKAVAHFRAFIELWKNADPVLQPRVAAARHRLASLAPVEKPR